MNKAGKYTVASLDQHPSFMALRSRTRSPAAGPVTAEELRQLCLEAGADDVGFVRIDRPEIASDKNGVLQVFPAAKVLISVVCRMNREPIRSPARSVANLEFHRTGDHVNHVAGEIVRRLEDRGIRAMNAPAGFPMETSDFPGKIWVVSHKPVAVAAGLGQMGLHRNVIHPRYGSFILLGTIFVDVELDQDSRPVDYNPCVNCKLCVAACPVGAIRPDGGIDAVYHMIFTGREKAEATVTIRRQTLNVQRSLIGKPDCTVTADSRSWLGFLRKERSIAWALLTGQIRVRGGLSRLQAFGRCFPG